MPADPHVDAPEERGALFAAVSARARRRLGALVLALFALAVIGFGLGGRGGVKGPAPGTRLPPFAVPLALGDLRGDPNIATAPDQGTAGSHPACTVRGEGILNLCELYERAPVVLGLFFQSASCPRIAMQLQSLAASFPGVKFAAVAIKGGRVELRKRIAAERLTLPVGFDRDGALASLYEVVTCTQIDFAYPGGVVQSPALLTPPPPGTLRARVGELVAAAEARGWRRPSRPPDGSTAG